MKLLSVLCILFLAGCVAPSPTDYRENPSSNGVKIVEFLATGNQNFGNRGEFTQTPIPINFTPADYGARDDGAFWVDGIIEAESYKLMAPAVITTHTHGIVIIASHLITIDGEINVRGLGASPNQTGYDSSRASMLNIYRNYGAVDENTGEPLLWGAGGDGCAGGGYIIINAPNIIFNGTLDAGSECAQGGIIYLEGNVSGAGIAEASLIIHRGTVA